MKLSVKNLFIFFLLYFLDLILVAFIVLIIRAKFWDLLPHEPPGASKSYLLLPFPTRGATKSMISGGETVSRSLPTSYLGILLNLTVLMFSAFFVFKKKAKLKHWLIIFTIFNLLVIGFFQIIISSSGLPKLFLLGFN